MKKKIITLKPAFQHLSISDPDQIPRPNRDEPRPRVQTGSNNKDGPQSELKKTLSMYLTKKVKRSSLAASEWTLELVCSIKKKIILSIVYDNEITSLIDIYFYE